MTMTRTQLRHQLAQQRLTLSPLEIQQYSLHASKLLCSQPLFEKSQHIACYLATRNEICCQYIIEQIFQKNKFCYLPIVDRVEKGGMEFVRYRPNDLLQKNHYGILEPAFSASHCIKPKELDLIIMPLVGFDRHGHRLGSGAGYYDRALAHTSPHHPHRIGLAYSFQEVPLLETASWDIDMHGIITEKTFHCID